MKAHNLLPASLLLLLALSVASLPAGAAREADMRFLALAGAELRITLIAPETPRQAEKLEFEIAAKANGAPPVDWRSVRLQLTDGSSLAPSAVSFPEAVKADEWTRGALAFDAPGSGFAGRITLVVPKGGPGAPEARLIWNLPEADGSLAGPT